MVSSAEYVDEDDISLASTVDSVHSEEDEFSVRDILNMVPHDRNLRGENLYLVEWEGYELHRASYEPESNLTEEIINMWKEKAEKSERGEDVYIIDEKTFEIIRDSAEKEKQSRHQRRVEKRARIAAWKEQNQAQNSLRSGNSSDGNDKADEDNAIDDQVAPKERQPKQSTFKGIPAAQPATTAPTKPVPKFTTTKPVPASTAKSPQNNARRLSIGDKPIVKLATNKTMAAPAGSVLPRPRVKKPDISTTGYQGTSRKIAPTGQLPTLPKPGGDALAKTPLASPATRSITSEMASSLTGKKKTAKKTGAQKTTPVGNVFAGGKVRKKKSTLIEVMNDPASRKKESHFFSTAHLRRKAELKARENSDSGPANISSIPASLLGPPGPASFTESAGRSGSPLDDVDSLLVCSSPSVHEQSDADAEEVRPRKRYKTVRFLEDSVITKEPMEIDSGSVSTLNQPLHGSTKPRRSALKVSSSDYRPASLPVTKNITFGTTPSEVISVIFEGIPRDKELKWAGAFLQLETLQLDRVCQVNDIQHRLDSEPLERLSAGSLKSLSADAESVMETTAARLRIGEFALFASQPEFCILICPTKSEDWMKVIGEGELSGATTDCLKYCIFHTPSLVPTIKPLNLPLPPASENMAELSLWMREFFGWEYRKLLAPKLQQDPTKPHWFYLIFPPSPFTLVSYSVLVQWLRACKPDCVIYSCREPGSWDNFYRNCHAGTVIFHESTINSIRRIPHLAKMLQSNRHIFFKFIEFSVKENFAYLSGQVMSRETNRMELSLMFPHGGAIFITPSFVVSDPKNALGFFKWYFVHQRQRPFWKLVAPYSFDQYLIDLALEKRRSDSKLSPEYTTQSEMQLEMANIIRELSRQEIGLMRTMATPLMGTRSNGFTKSCPVIYAPSHINPNDEQSLVNWFCTWTLQHLHEHRKFYVLGSTPNAAWNSLVESRTIKMPSYARHTISDPEVLLAKQDQERHKREEARYGAQIETNADETMNSDAVNATGSTSADQSVLFQQVHSVDFHKFLKGLNSDHFKDGFKVWKLYDCPVSWTDSKMQFHFEFNPTDIRYSFEYFDSWWKYSENFFAWPGFNTYIGLFYTLDTDFNGELDEEKYPRGLMPKRHPWIVILRPRNPHWRTVWEKEPRCELLIWDMRAGERFPAGTQPSYSALPYMQQRLIMYVQEHTGQKYTSKGGTKRSVLSSVYLGGFEWPQSSPSNHPLDVTATYLQQMLQNPKEKIPPDERLLPCRGFRTVEHDTKESMSSSTSDAVPPPHSELSPPPQLPETMDLDPGPALAPGTAGALPSDDDAIDMNEFTIYHPPRGHSKYVGRTKCVNRLYEKVQTTLDIKPMAEKVTVEFEPTTVWYKQQVDEGRSFDYVIVEGWQTLSKLWGVPQAMAARAARDRRDVVSDAGSSDYDNGKP